MIFFFKEIFCILIPETERNSSDEKKRFMHPDYRKERRNNNIEILLNDIKNLPYLQIILRIQMVQIKFLKTKMESVR